MNLSSDVHRIQLIHTMERNKHSQEQDEEMKIPKQNTNIANLNTVTRYRTNNFSQCNVGGNHAIIILKKDVSASVPKSSNRLYNSNQ